MKSRISYRYCLELAVYLKKEKIIGAIRGCICKQTRHIIEVRENMKVVCRRFLDSGMTPEQVAKRMDVSMKFVNACMR